MHDRSARGRRSFLKYGAAGAATLLAGCSGGGGQSSGGGGSGSTPAPATTQAGGTGGGGSTGTAKTTKQPEGPVLMYGNVPSKEAQAAFTKKTGIEVNAVATGGSQGPSRFINESQAGQPTADVLVLPNLLTPLLAGQTDKFASWDNPNTDHLYHSPPWFNTPDYGSRLHDSIDKVFGSNGTSMVYPVSHSVWTFYIHVPTVPNPPASFQDITASRFNGSIAAAPYLMDVALASMELVGMDSKTAENLLVKIDDNGIVYAGGSSNNAQKVGSGQLDIGFWFPDHYVPGPNVQGQPPLGSSYPPKTTTMTWCAIATSAGQHTEAGKAYVEFLTSKEGQNIYKNTAQGFTPAYEGLKHPNPYLLQQYKKYVKQMVPIFLTPKETKAYAKRASNLLGVQA